MIENCLYYLLVVDDRELLVEVLGRRSQTKTDQMCVNSKTFMKEKVYFFINEKFKIARWEEMLV